MNPGRFIVVEGLEGAGKSSAMQAIARYLKEKDYPYIETREPGGTLIAENLRQIIKEKNPAEPLDARSELLLVYAARVQLIENCIKPALKQGYWVLSDRFELSTFAYQGGGRGLDEQMINQLSAFCLEGFKPDLILFLDIDYKQGLARVRKRGEFDRIEEEDEQFFKRIHQSYQKIIKKLDNVVSINASLPIESVQKSILNEINAFMTLHAPA